VVASHYYEDQFLEKEEFKQWIIGDGGVKLSLFTLQCALCKET
jgi:hypothetical protein